MANASMRIEGLADLQRALKELPERLQKKALATAVAKGARVIGRDAQSRVPVLKKFDSRRTPGLLKRLIRVSRGVRRTTEAAAFVSVRRMNRKQIARFKAKTGYKGADNPFDPFYWRFVEFGTSKMAAQPFLRPAFEAQKELAARTIGDELAVAIEKEARQLYRRIAR